MAPSPKTRNGLAVSKTGVSAGNSSFVMAPNILSMRDLSDLSAERIRGLSVLMRERLWFAPTLCNRETGDGWQSFSWTESFEVLRQKPAAEKCDFRRNFFNNPLYKIAEYWRIAEWR